MAAPRDYTKAVYEKCGSWGTFPLDLPLAVGDIIQLNKDGKMSRLDSVLNWPGWPQFMPIDSQTVNAATSWAHHAAKSSAGAIHGGATAGAGVGATAEIKVSFSAVGGFMLDFVSGTYRKFRSVITAQSAVLGLSKNGQWKPEYALITEVTEASPATVLMSAAKDTSVVLSAKAKLPDNLAGINLADPQFGFSVASADSDIYHSVSQEAWPLFHCVRIRRHWWGGKFAELQGSEVTNLDEVFSNSPFEDDDV